MKNTTVRARIIACFSAVILLMIGLCAFAYVQLRTIQDRADEGPVRVCSRPVYWPARLADRLDLNLYFCSAIGPRAGFP